MNYRKIWEKHNKKSIPTGHEIHHIDGNKKNNHPSNLICVTIEEHLNIHTMQEDWGAVQAILIRMKDYTRLKEKIKESASKLQKQKWINGTHNFQKISKEERIIIAKRTIQERISNGYGAFFMENAVENARRAGLASKEKNAGFLNINSDKHGSNYVKNTYWWTHISGKRVRVVECPGIEWKRGMKNESEIN